MEILCAPSGIVSRERPEQGILDLAEAGFRNMLLDMGMYCPPGELEQTGRSGKGQERRPGILLSECPSELGNCLKTMVESCRRSGLGMPLAAAPCLAGDTGREDMGELLGRLAGESVRVCAEAGAGYLMVKPLFAGIARGKEWDVNREYYLRLAREENDKGVMILLVNQCRNINGRMARGICAEAEEAAAWVDRLNREAGGERFGFCMDVGAYNLCGQNMREAAVTLGSRVKAVILRDCDTQRENAMLPFTYVGQGQSRTDWLGLIRGLREIGFDGLLALAFGDTASAFSPLLRPGLLQLARDVGEYFGWQIGIEGRLKKYGSRVLFGAGNMCRNYMKCYGRQYPPLFTCDNNPALWGEDFCGLEIKPPEKLKDLPEDCAIFICNIYYREIKRQLREMNVRNPIEFFNDEYMPSFHYDRLPAGRGALAGSKP